MNIHYGTETQVRTSLKLRLAVVASGLLLLSGGAAFVLFLSGEDTGGGSPTPQPVLTRNIYGGSVTAPDSDAFSQLEIQSRGATTTTLGWLNRLFGDGSTGAGYDPLYFQVTGAHSALVIALDLDTTSVSNTALRQTMTFCLPASTQTQAHGYFVDTQGNPYLDSRLSIPAQTTSCPAVRSAALVTTMVETGILNTPFDTQPNTLVTVDRSQQPVGRLTTALGSWLWSHARLDPADQSPLRVVYAREFRGETPAIPARTLRLFYDLDPSNGQYRQVTLCLPRTQLVDRGVGFATETYFFDGSGLPYRDAHLQFSVPCPSTAQLMTMVSGRTSATAAGISQSPGTDLALVLETATPTIVAGQDVDVTMRLVGTPPAALWSFQGVVTGLTSRLIDTNANTSQTKLNLVGTLTEGWLSARNFCPGPTCAAGYQGTPGMLVVSASGTSPVTTGGLFLTVRVRALATAIPGQYTVGVEPLNGIFFNEVNAAGVRVFPATINVLPNRRGGKQTFAP